MFEIEKRLKKNANVSRNIRFNEELFEQLAMAAGKYNVSFNHLVLQCCKYALENMVESDEIK